MVSALSRLRYVPAGVLVLSSIQAAHGAAVAVGESKLIGTIDFSDTWTLTEDGGVVPERITGSLRPQIAYTVESTYGTANPVQFTQVRNDTSGGVPVTPPRPNMSFSADTPNQSIATTANSPYPGTSGAGSDSGFTQNGGAIDYGIPYNLRDEYIVQFDAIQSRNRIDITSGEVAGTISQSNSVSIFFRGTDYASDPIHSDNVSLYTVINGLGTDTPIRGERGYENFSTGLSTDPTRDWHNYAVRFDSLNNDIEIYLDEVSLVLLDLDTFAGGMYADFANDAVSVGGAGERQWSDNFQVGAVPEPTALAAFGLGAFGLLRRRRR